MLETPFILALKPNKSIPNLAKLAESVPSKWVHRGKDTFVRTQLIPAESGFFPEVIELIFGGAKLKYTDIKKTDGTHSGAITAVLKSYKSQTPMCIIRTNKTTNSTRVRWLDEKKHTPRENSTLIALFNKARSMLFELK